MYNVVNKKEEGLPKWLFRYDCAFFTPYGVCRKRDMNNISKEEIEEIKKETEKAREKAEEELKRAGIRYMEIEDEVKCSDEVVKEYSFCVTDNRFLPDDFVKAAALWCRKFDCGEVLMTRVRREENARRVLRSFKVNGEGEMTDENDESERKVVQEFFVAENGHEVSKEAGYKTRLTKGCEIRPANVYLMRKYFTDAYPELAKK